MNKIRKSLTILLLAISTSCSMPELFQVVINQGNLVDEEMLGKLEVGLTESQVKYILGTPLISDTFNPKRWDYYTAVSKGDVVFSESKISLYFEEGKLIRWEGSLPSTEG
ncbi:MAG: outer membrane protein assembly factor BamE [Gammaproteobacteria bacterium]